MGTPNDESQEYSRNRTLQGPKYPNMRSLSTTIAIRKYIETQTTLYARLNMQEGFAATARGFNCKFES